MAARHKTVHHLSQKADGSYSADQGWVESIAGLAANSSATNLLHDQPNGRPAVSPVSSCVHVPADTDHNDCIPSLSCTVPGQSLSSAFNAPRRRLHQA